MKPWRLVFQYMLFSAVILGCAWVSAAALAADSAPAKGNTSVGAALASCAATVAKDANGGPDQQAMIACMTAKGFVPPAGGTRAQGGDSAAPAKK
jgi:hypothetical protein